MKIKAKQLSLDSTVTPTTATIDLGSDASPLQAVHSSEFVGELTGAVRFKAKNETGAAIAKGAAVYINGVSGEVPTIALADADVSTAMPSVGLTETAANNNAEVYIVSFGNLTGLNTAALGSNIVGKAVYIDTTAGGLTITPPSTNSAKLQNIGQVIREHATAGIIKVGGAGRTAATPNLDSGHFFIGSSNQSTQSSYELPTSIGTSGHVLTSDGTNVTFQAASGGGGSPFSENVLPSAADTYDLGSSSAEWKDLYLGDESIIYLGNDQDVQLKHSPDEGVILDMTSAGGYEPKFIMESNNDSNTGSTILGKHQTTSPAAGDRIFRIWGQGRKQGTSADVNYGAIDIISQNVTSSEPRGQISLYCQGSSNFQEGLRVYCDATATATPKVRISDAFDLPNADGSANQVLQTDGNGAVTWATVSAGGGAENYTYSAVTQTNSPLTPSADYHYSVNADGSSVNFAINLPTLSSLTDGQSIRIKFRARSGSNNVVITAQSGETIDGANTYTLDNLYSSITLVVGSTEWEIV